VPTFLQREATLPLVEGAGVAPVTLPWQSAKRLTKTEDGELLVEEDEDKRFKVAWAGEHLMVPFQCKLCHFRNILL
jgi:hypothetical protein